MFLAHLPRALKHTSGHYCNYHYYTIWAMMTTSKFQILQVSEEYYWNVTSSIKLLLATLTTS